MASSITGAHYNGCKEILHIKKMFQGSEFRPLFLPSGTGLSMALGKTRGIFGIAAIALPNTTTEFPPQGSERPFECHPSPGCAAP